MGVQQIQLKPDGTMAVGTGGVLAINYETYNVFDAAVVLDVAFFSKVKTPTEPSDITAVLTWRDTYNDDVVYRVQGNLSRAENDYNSLWNVAGMSEYFKSFDVLYRESDSGTLVLTVKNSSAFNPVDGLGRNKQTIGDLTVDNVAFNSDSLYNALVTLDERPSHIVLNRTNDLVVYNTLLRVIDKLNVPLDIELDPTLTVAQAVAMATSLSAQDDRVQIIWSPNKARPRDAVTLKGRKKPCRAMGQYTGMKMLRNAVTSAKGIPRIESPIAGVDYPFTYPAMELAVALTEQDLEQLAKAKINVVRPINYDVGTFFVMSDILTQYPQKNSALRLVNVAEIVCYTTNRCTDILKRHMLKKTSGFLRDASRDIQEFLDGCVGADLLSASEELGGKPYSFTLVPDDNFPFERVRFYLARRPQGAVRAVIFDSDVVVK